MTNSTIEGLIETIRKQEREKLLEEISVVENSVKPWDIISNHIEGWGKLNGISPWHLCKIKNSVYTIVRYTLDIDRMSSLREEQIAMAEQIVNNILGMIQPVKE